ncbi:MAG: hypothetical protein EPN69_03200 [Rhodanobacter sp.]|nr:MAG: hypothetical protein EPN71_13945 [Rhodanobacter sp.]TAL97425.1 MAG: hypothetical protein EPN69_03200 [Rhodanobacter sp.]TAM39729.1 MAG: hypothetical protein EPN58_12865 [Rhodanobacter sp.]
MNPFRPERARLLQEVRATVRLALPLLDLIGVTPSLRHDVQRFLLAISWGAPALTCYFALRGLSEGLSLTRPSMYFSLGGLVLLVPLDYVLMFGKLGIAPQGAHGCGVATAIVLWLEMLAFGVYVLFRRNYHGMGARGMWIGLIAGLSVAAALLFTRFWRRAWQPRRLAVPMTAPA